MNIGEDIINFLISENGNMHFSIAFLPYKKAMWDCMQSVYEKAVEKGLDAYIVPIPYLLKTGDFNNSWRYEANEYTDYDIVDFNDFDKLKVDVAVIHNPYDDTNKITMVHPDFFSDALKEKVKKLVYIPYYKPSNGVSHDWTILQKGVVNADYVFVDSEEERERFISKIKEAYGIDKSNQIFASGSPKEDMYSKEIEFEYPSEWDDKLDSFSKYTLVITSLQPFLSDVKGSIDKLNNKFKEVSKKGDLLWYRPHPLLLDTLKIMQPSMVKKYERLLEKASHIGIVDNTPELDRAIVSCDYMISQKSSIVELWKLTNKKYEVI